MKILLTVFLLSSFLYSSENKFEYFTQVYATKNKETLQKMLDLSTSNGLNYITRERFVDNNLYYRILIGPYKTKELANIELDMLKKLFKNKTAYISKFKIQNTEIKTIKEKGYLAYLDRDFSLMNKYLEEAAKLGDKESIYYIGKNYHNGIGIVQDVSKAIFWYEKCLDDARCLNALGQIYLNYNLKSIKPDFEKAFSYISKASKKGSAKAKVLLENRLSLEKTHKILKSNKIDIKLIELLFYQNNSSTKIENLQIINKYEQEGATNLNTTLILNKKVKDVFFRIKKNKNDYWEVLDFKIY